MFDEKAYNRKWKAENRARVLETTRAWRERNKEKLQAYEANRKNSARRKAQRIANYHADPEKSRNAQFYSKYRMSPEDIVRFDAATSCSLCKKPVPPRGTGERHKLHVDHCHTTGKIRGFLCNRCNTGLGKLGDDEAGLLRALEYVRANH
jgi:hypothetical protein